MTKRAGCMYTEDGLAECTALPLIVILYTGSQSSRLIHMTGTVACSRRPDYHFTAGAAVAADDGDDDLGHL